MPLILKTTLEKGDGKETAEEVEGLDGADTNSVEEKKRQDAEINKKLNDKAFLNFLQKNPDAVNNATDDDYLKGKIEVFEKVQKVKQEVKKFIVNESSVDYGGIVDDSFVESIESIAIKTPDDFLDFSGKISKYLESVEKSKSLEITYQQAAKSLGIDIDYNRLSAEGKRKFIDDIHNKTEELSQSLDQELSETENRKIFTRSRIPFTKTRENWKSKIDTLNSTITNLKTATQKLDRNSISLAIDEMEAIKNGLKGNQAFEIVRSEFKKKAEARIKDAIKARQNGSLSKDRDTLERLNISGSILEEEEFSAMEASINKYSKETVNFGTKDTFDKEATLNSFEKGIESTKKEGLKLGLSSEECDEQIVMGLKDKIDQLTKNIDAGQNKIKLILAKRILNNLEQ